MQTTLTPSLQGTTEGTEAAGIVQKCVHCGFCNATCPTYQLLGDELDGPRGRIYLIRQVLEGQAPSARTQLHLDRCLTCRACETTCPSGVSYGRLLDIGRRLVDEQVPRPTGERLLRSALKTGLTGALFAPALRLGQALRPLLPAVLRRHVPVRQDAGESPVRQHARRVVMPAGCVQPALAPNINAATVRVLDAIGISTVTVSSGCCGAIRHHLNDQAGGLDDARRNVDRWWPLLESGCEAIVSNASGCGVMVRDYGHLLRDDPAYAARAVRVSAAVRDIAELVAPAVALLQARLGAAGPDAAPVTDPGAGAAGSPMPRVVFHPPCTLQHGQRIRGQVEALLAALGVRVLPFAEAHLCCGSAGTYSVLQPQLAAQLRDRKLAALQAPEPELILSANIGCITHLGGAARVPVQHWVEWLDARLQRVP